MNRKYFYVLILATILYTGFSYNVRAQFTHTYQSGERLYEDAQDLMAKSQYLAAQNHFQQYIDLGLENEKTINAYYYRALCALKMNAEDTESLLQSFVQAYPQHPKAAGAYLEWGNYYYQQRDYAKAIQYYETIPEGSLSQKSQEEVDFRTAMAFFKQKKFNEAESIFNRLKTGNSDFAYAASYYAGYIAYQQARYDTALPDLQKASQSADYENYTPALIANIYYQSERYDELIAYSTPLLTSLPNMEKYQEVALLTADAYFLKKDYTSAEIYYRKYLERVEVAVEPMVLYRLGFSQYQQQQYAASIDNLKPIASQNTPEGQSAAYYLGIAYFKTNNKRFAITAFEQAQSLRFNVIIEQEAALMLSKLHYELEQYDEAINYLKIFTERYPQHPEHEQALLLLSRAYIYSNQHREAITYIEALPQKSPAVLSAYQQVTYSQGIEYFNKTQYDAAIALFQKSANTQQNPTLVLLARFWIGEAYLLQEKHPQAINAYQQVLSLGAVNTPYTLQAHYGIAYAYFNIEKYELAIPHFQVYVQTARGQIDNKYYEDAFIRLADCYYAQKDYPSALNFYEKIIQSNYIDKDYACYQRGNILFLQGQSEAAKASLDIILREYPNSIHYDEALYQKAFIDLYDRSYAVAISGFSALINQKLKSPLRPEALLRRALAYRNIGKDDEAIRDYQTIINEYTTHANANSALLSLQESLSAQGREAEFTAYLNKYQQANPNSSTTEKIYFENSKSAYLRQEYDQAIRGFNDYLNKYPQSPFRQDAQFFLAEAYYRSGNPSNALQFYKQVVADGRSEYVNRSALRAGNLEYSLGGYRNSINMFRFLAGNTQSKREQILAWTGLIECYYQMRRYDSLYHFADQVIAQSNVAGAKNKANLYKGKAAYQQKDYLTAQKFFQSTAASSNDENGAEAQYLTALIYYEQAQYKTSLETLFDLNKKFSQYEWWRGKAFLLIADNYLAQGETFQAKATLQSIIDKSPEARIVQEARTKLSKIQ